MIVTNNPGAVSQDGPVLIPRACAHQPPCPSAYAADREAAQLVVSYPQQGWSLLCNGVTVFDDTGDLLPDGSVIAPRRVQ